MTIGNWKPREFVKEFQRRAGLFIDGIPGPQTQAALCVMPQLPPETPTPIDPADIRPGDVFRVIYQATCERIDESAEAIVTTTNVYWDRAGDPNATYHLVHRPDPDAEAVEALAKVMHDDRCCDECCDGCDMGDYEHDAERIIHSARERGWDVVRRAES